MQVGGFNVVKVLVICVVTLALLFGVQFLYNHFNYEKPVAETLDEINGIESYQFSSHGERNQLIIKLKKVPNLQDTYTAITGALVNIKQSPVEIVIWDSPNDALQQFWYESQFVIYEGIQSGWFVDMKNKLEQLTRVHDGITARVFLDNRRVYFQASDGDYYLYKVIDRKLGGEPVA